MAVEPLPHYTISPGCLASDSLIQDDGFDRGVKPRAEHEETK